MIYDAETEAEAAALQNTISSSSSSPSPFDDETIATDHKQEQRYQIIPLFFLVFCCGSERASGGDPLVDLRL